MATGMLPTTAAQMNTMDTLYTTISNEPNLELQIKDLRKMVLETKFPGSIVPRTDPEFLARFIRVKDYKVEKALKGVQKYYKCIHKHMDQHIGLRPSQVASVYSSETYLVLKHRFDGVGIVVGRIKHWNTKEVKLIEFQKAGIFGAEQYLNEVGIQLNGAGAIVDFEGLRFEHLWYASIKEIRQCVEVAVKGLPVRLRECHVLNTPKIFWPIYHIGKRFVKKKYLDRVHFHDNLESLHKHMDKRMLPQSLGGDLSDADASERHVVESIVKHDIPFEEYWNGAIWKPNPEQMNRRRSTTA